MIKKLKMNKMFLKLFCSLIIKYCKRNSCGEFFLSNLIERCDLCWMWCQVMSFYFLRSRRKERVCNHQTCRL